MFVHLNRKENSKFHDLDHPFHYYFTAMIALENSKIEIWKKSSGNMRNFSSTRFSRPLIAIKNKNISRPCGHSTLLSFIIYTCLFIILIQWKLLGCSVKYFLMPFLGWKVAESPRKNKFEIFIVCKTNLNWIWQLWIWA